MENSDDAAEESSTLNRRKLLSISAGSAATLAGLGAVTGSAIGWEPSLDAEFKGCSEVWLLVSERDLNCDGQDPDDCPLTVDVVVASGGEAICRSVTITPEKATTIPGQHGETPIIKYSVSGGEKILGVIGNSSKGNPLASETIQNTHRCTQTPHTPSFEDADCYGNRR